MNKLLKEFLSYILIKEGYSEELKRRMGIPANAVARGKYWYDGTGENAKYLGLVKNGKFVPALPGEKPGDDKKPDELPPEVIRVKPPERYMGAGAGGDQRPAKRKTKPAITVNHGITPTDSATGIIQKLINSAKMLVGARRKGIPGPGGAVASYGEATLTELCNRLTQGGLQQGLGRFREENKERITNKKEQIQQILDNGTKKEKTSLEAKISALGAILGLDPNVDRKFIIEYLAAREAYVEEELKRLEADPKSIFHRKGNAGFGKNREAAEEWARAAFDGAVATSISMQSSLIDSTRPFTVIQSDAVPGGHDDAIVAHLTAMRDAAPEGSDDRRHYETQLKAWEVAKFHDTMVVGEDAQGRMVVFHVTNKKGNDLKDIWNNTTPADAMRSLHDKFAEEAKRTGEGGLTADEKRGFAEVQVVLQRGVEICEDAAAAATGLWSDESFKIDDKLVDAAHALRSPKDYVGDLGDWMDKEATSRSGAAKKDFNAWATGKGKRVVSEMNAVCKGKGSTSRECTKQRMSVMRTYMKTNPKNKPPFEPVGKLLVKIGEVQIAKDKRSGKSSTGSLGECVRVKQEEKQAVEAAHKAVVNKIQTVDAELCKNNPKSCKPNGPATRMYLTQVMHSMHFDIMAENWDEHLGAVTGGRASQPNDFRTALAEHSGFAKDNPEPTSPQERAQWRAKLIEHIINNATVSAESGAIKISQGGESGSEFELVTDSWRTAGSGNQKVQKNVGEDVRKSVIGTADSRRKDSGNIIRDSFK